MSANELFEVGQSFKKFPVNDLTQCRLNIRIHYQLTIFKKLKVTVTVRSYHSRSPSTSLVCKLLQSPHHSGSFYKVLLAINHSFT